MRLIGIVVCSTAVLCASCASGGRPLPGSPAATSAVAPASVQVLYESGRDLEVVRSVAARADASGAELWFSAHSHFRLAAADEGTAGLMRLSESPEPEWRAAAQLALNTRSGDREALERARTAAAAYPDHPFVLYELGASYASQNDYARAAQAFDACIEADRSFAYAYYQSALAYERLDRNDLVVIRLDAFVRAAPNAPERLQAELVLRTVRTR